MRKSKSLPERPKPTSVRIPEDLKAKVLRLGRLNDRSFNKMVLILLAKAVELETAA